MLKAVLKLEGDHNSLRNSWCPPSWDGDPPTFMSVGLSCSELPLWGEGAGSTYGASLTEKILQGLKEPRLALSLLSDLCLRLVVYIPGCTA